MPLTEQIKPSTPKAFEGGRATKGEKEAVATVFFQQAAENPHFRRRLSIVKARNSRLRPDTSHAHIALDQLAPALSLDAIPSTSVGVVCHSAVMKMSASALHFWNKIGLRPYSGPKYARIIVLAASSIATEEVQSALQPWLEDLSIAYKVRLF
jgi:hypothetical protein